MTVILSDTIPGVKFNGFFVGSKLSGFMIISPNAPADLMVSDSLLAPFTDPLEPSLAPLLPPLALGILIEPIAVLTSSNFVLSPDSKDLKLLPLNISCNC